MNIGIIQCVLMLKEFSNIFAHWCIDSFLNKYKLFRNKGITDYVGTDWKLRWERGCSHRLRPQRAWLSTEREERQGRNILNKDVAAATESQDTGLSAPKGGWAMQSGTDTV